MYKGHLRRTKSAVAASIVTFLLFVPVHNANAGNARVEVGSSRVESLDFEVPRGATRVAVPGEPTQFSGRLWLSFDLSDTGTLRFLYAPFRVERASIPDSPIRFMDRDFAAGVPTRIGYTFNSYRASYIHRWNRGERFRPQLGFTAKIRDAVIEVESVGVTKSRANVGFVPLINAGFIFEIASNWSLVFDVDGAVARQGRAIDGALELRYGLGPWSVGTGYRVLDGGVDTPENRSFANFQTIFLSLGRDF